MNKRKTEDKGTGDNMDMPNKSERNKKVNSTMDTENKNQNEVRPKISEEKKPGQEILTTVTTHGPGQQQVAVPNIIPLLPIRNAVAFPGTVIPLNIGRETSKKSVENALADNKLLGIITQRDPQIENPKTEDLYTWGTVGFVLKLLKMNDGDQTIVIHGLLRFKILQILQTEPFLLARIEIYNDPKESSTDNELEALVHNVRTMANRVIELSQNVPDEASVILNNITQAGTLADFLAANLNITIEQKQDILETLPARERMEKVSTAIANQLDVLELSSKLQDQVKESINKTQRQYFLQEQMKAIQKELGETDQRTGELEELRKRIAEAKMPPDVEKEALREMDRMSKIPLISPEYSVARDYVEWLVVLPWSKQTTDSLDIKKAKKILDTDHYDLEKVKKRIIEFLAVRKLKPEGRGPILCFVGPPGVGKTSLGKSIARAMGRKFVRISLGGIRDEAEIRGHRRTYIGAMPGRVMQELRKVAVRNPIFMLDEVDKIGQDFRGDPSSALLEVLDPEQNNSFTDHYLDVPFDLSRVMFISTANVMQPVPPALRDRMEVIELPGYTMTEKLQIAKKYLLPKQLDENGLNKNNLSFTDEGLKTIIESYTREAGVRNLEREIGNICRAVAAKIAGGSKAGVTLTHKNVPNYLGPIKIEPEVALRTSIPGVATGLAYTPYGGDIIFIEATSMPGKGGLTLTGQIGDVMKESAQAAYSLLRSRAKKMKIDPAKLAEKDFHIHVPEGAVPKDGPSAGVAIFTALVSLETGVCVRHEVAMTGEITLRGLVLPIGGVKEKVLAAKRAGIREVILPARNEKDLYEVPKDVQKTMKFHFVNHVDRLLQLALDHKENGKKKTNESKKKKIN
jgi:ATP-dependent Lon protease